MLRARIEALQLPMGWYDGELVACDDCGPPDFGRLQDLLAKRKVADCLTYCLFDVLYVLDHDLRRVALAERRQTLQAILAARPDALVQFSGELKGEPAYGRWVKSILLAEVSFAERSKAGKVRHSLLHGVKAASPIRIGS